GTLIYLYASSYLYRHQYINRVYCYLTIFMGAMLGLVLSDNLISLFIFWELTSISSFFLIGFNTDDEDSRKSAIWALSLTGLGGFFLLGAFVIINTITGTYSIHELFTHSDLLVQHPYYYWLLIFLFLGTFTKSAQFPFHFWLPGAMKAPTPVSAYLHSATMVKAGIYLLARLTPALGNTELWNTTLMVVGGFTMIFAAIHSLFRTDLKGILAYSTVSALGILTFLLGLGTTDALIAMSVFILVHALYKATLFMVTGIIDHQTHTRDVTKLQGLRKVMMPVFIAALLAALSSACLPLTYGFIGKDLIYEATLNLKENWAIWLTALAVLTNIGLVTAGFRAGITPFTGKLPEGYQDVKMPYRAMWIPPMILAILGIVFGLFPGVVGDYFNYQTANAIAGTDTDMHLKLWHGFNTVLTLSVATLAAGAALYFAHNPTEEKLLSLARFDV